MPACACSRQQKFLGPGRHKVVREEEGLGGAAGM